MRQVPKLQTTPTLGGETAQISPESMQHSTVPGLPETPSSSEKTIAPTLHGTPGVPDEKNITAFNADRKLRICARRYKRA